jgi:hypothetical protein
LESEQPAGAARQEDKQQGASVSDKRGFSPAWVLFIVAPVVGELLSGSAPPAEFFTPFGLIALPLLYGGGAIICRELTHRWGKGWPTLLLLGAAYGVLEEGIVCASFFNAHWPDVGPLGEYGRWLGVNWLWSVSLTVYHSAISVGTSVLIVNHLFPRRRDDAWLGRVGFAVVCILYVPAMALLTLAIATYMHFPPPPVHSVGALVVIALFGLAARHAPQRIMGADASGVRCVRPILFGVAGFFGLLGFFLLMYGSRSFGLPAPVAFLLVPTYVLLFAGLVWLMSGRGGGLGERHMLALGTGALLFFGFVDVMREAHKEAQTDNPTGLSIVALLALIFLTWLNLRARRRVRRGAAADAVRHEDLQQAAEVSARRGFSPAWVLYITAPVVGELVLGASPPAKFFTPFGLIALPLLYGGGAIICRELTHRWGKGWPTLLLLGAAYGVLEEGLVCSSFFNAHWEGAGVLGEYGRWLGVNWVWSVSLTVYHSAISIGVSVLLVNHLFPRRRADSWVGRRTFGVVCMLYAVGVTLLALALASYTHFPLPPGRSAGAAVVMVLFALAARRAPHHIIGAGGSGARCVRPILFGVVGFLGMFGFFLLMYGAPGLGLPALVTFFLVPTYVVLFAGLLWLMSGRGGGLGERHMLALGTGPLLFFGVFGVFREANKASQPDNPTGLSLVALSSLCFLAWLNLRTRRRVLRAASADDEDAAATDCTGLH